MRGEDGGEGSRRPARTGSPPHARGRRGGVRDARRRMGITPACAGKTLLAKTRKMGTRGSPPHARGRQMDHAGLSLRPRITPACAGKTLLVASRTNSHLDHPRMRGEDAEIPGVIVAQVGSPPHARGRPRLGREINFERRITPACAGKTVEEAFPGDEHSDHPRMRGEDYKTTADASPAGGSPPHARGRRAWASGMRRGSGITPACAGKTPLGGVGLGEQNGSPPHARGRQLDSPGNPAKSSSSLPVFLHSQPNPLKRFFRRVLGL